MSIISQVADALDSAHADGVIHRDVKPSNVLIARHVATRHGRDEFAYLVDFGIARSLGGTGMTSVGFTVGTIDYMAPERFDGQQSGIGADVYALGCLLAECLTGRKPFPGAEVGAGRPRAPALAAAAPVAARPGRSRRTGRRGRPGHGQGPGGATARPGNWPTRPGPH